MTTSIDRADWHYGGDFPGELPRENGGTHIGMYLAWTIERGLASAMLNKQAKDSLPLLRERKITGRQLLFTELDEKFFSGLLTRMGRDFTRDYYETHVYIDDYETVLGGTLPSLYHVDDSWDNYDKLAPVIDQRFSRWRQGETPPASLLRLELKQLEEEYLDTILAVAGKLPADPLGAIAIFQQYVLRQPPPPFQIRAIREIERLRQKYRMQ